MYCNFLNIFYFPLKSFDASLSNLKILFLATPVVDVIVALWFLIREDFAERHSSDHESSLAGGSCLNVLISQLFWS
jgi:hypothetical protein